MSREISEILNLKAEADLQYLPRWGILGRPEHVIDKFPHDVTGWFVVSDDVHVSQTTFRSSESDLFGVLPHHLGEIT